MILHRMVIVCYDCTREEFVAGRKLLRAPARAERKQKRELRKRRILPSCILFTVLTTFFFNLMHRHGNPANGVVPTTGLDHLSRLWGTYASILGFLLVVVSSWTLVNYLPWQTSRENYRDATLTFDDLGIMVQLPGLRVLRRWEYFSAFAENDTLFLVRQNGDDGMILPKRLFNETELVQVRILLSEKLVITARSLVGGFEVKPV